MKRVRSNKKYKLSEEQRILLKNIVVHIEHNFHANLTRIIRLGTYTEQDKNLILNPLRNKYIEHLKQIES